MFTCDVAVLRREAGGGFSVLLIRRGHPPFQGCWALPGGFLELEEDLPDCAARELREETSLAVDPGALNFLGIYGAPERDPRGRVITATWTIELSAGATAAAKAGDDAAELAWFALEAPPAMAFDHARMLEDLRRRNPR